MTKTYSPIHCVKCGVLTERFSSQQKYCKPCKVVAKRENNLKWAVANPEKIRESNRNYNRTHREEKAKLLRNWRHTHPELARAAKRRTYIRRQEQIREYSRHYSKTHPERWTVWNHNRRARIKGNGGVLPTGVSDILFEQQNGICYLCGKLLYERFDDIPSIEHKVPVSRGGINDLSNVGLAHLSCNEKKGTKTVEEFITR